MTEYPNGQPSRYHYQHSFAHEGVGREPPSGMSVLEWLRTAFRDAESTEREARRKWAAMTSREAELLRTIETLEVTLRGASTRGEGQGMRDRVDDLRREHFGLAQQKTAVLQLLETARARTQAAERAWRNAEGEVSRLHGAVPQQERKVARQRQLVAQAERELERQRAILAEAEQKLEELRRQLARVTGERRG